MPEKRKKSVWREYAEAIVIALILAFFVRTFIIQAFKIPSGSMVPTLLVGDHLLVNKFIFRFRSPKRGEITVFKFPGDHKTDYIKRIVAIGGDTVEMRNGTLFINDSPIDEPYAYYEKSSSLMRSFDPKVVPPGEVFVMGDNRDNSYDSRFWGTVGVGDLVGKAMVIYWSWSGTVLDRERWKRIGDVIR